MITIILSIIGLSHASLWNLPPKSTAVVTGGTKGIGHSIVSELGLTFGCKILTCARNKSELNACVEEWRSKGMLVRGCVADISTTEVSVVVLKVGTLARWHLVPHDTNHCNNIRREELF